MSGKPRGPVDWARHYSGLRQSGEHPLLTAGEARAEVDRLSDELYYASDAHAFVGEMCDVVDTRHRAPVGGAMVSTGDVREWLKGPRCARMVAVDASLVPGRPEDGEGAGLLEDALRACVRKALEESGQSQAALARRLEVSTKHLNMMLRGHSPMSLSWAERILRACGKRLTIGEDQ